jgi:hypothetical protein
MRDTIQAWFERPLSLPMRAIGLVAMVLITVDVWLDRGPLVGLLAFALFCVVIGAQYV